MFKGLLGLILFVLDVWAIASIFNSNATGRAKLIWIIVVAALPFVGLIAWYFAGPKANYNAPR